MSADYDRLFNNSPGQADNEEATRTVDHATLAAAAQMSASAAAASAAGAESPLGPPVAGQPQQPPGMVPPPRPSEVTTQMPPTPPQFMQNGLMRSPQGAPMAGAQYEQPQHAPMMPPPPRHMQPPPQHYAMEPQVDMQWTEQHMPDQTSAATIGDHRAIDALSHVGVRAGVKMPSQRGWRHVLYLLTRINLGLSPDELYELDLYTRIRRNARDSYQIGVLGLKGGVGKTAVTVTLGSVMSKVRGDRILAVDADPDGGNLADRAGRQSAATISDLLSDKELARYNDIRAYTSMNASNLEVLSSAEYSVARRDFNEDDWAAAVKIVSQYYNLVLADCGAGLFHQASRAVPGANLRWSIGPPRLIESVTDLKSGASVAEIQSIPMRLEADSVHEREWLDLLARLNNARKAQLRVQSCEWGASSLPYGPGTVSVMRSLCDVLWIHAQPPVPTDKPPGS